MSKTYTFMDLFNVLPKTNCGRCNVLTCLAFSLLVFKGEKRLKECPFISQDIIERFEGKIDTNKTFEQNLSKIVEQFKAKICNIDLSMAAEKVGGDYEDGKLTIRVLGKPLSIDSQGRIFTDIHMHPWVLYPILSYILNCKGAPLSGIWVPFRELKGGKKWNPLFEQRCLKPLKNLADIHTDLLKDIIDIFSGQEIESYHNSDISLVMYPLPKIPILLSYWKAEEGQQSHINLFFDSNVEENLNIEALYALCNGLVMMFEKIVQRIVLL
ncbi:MAG: DUF3786 domain-containing protein [Thermodesulfovibrionales bacterium]|nr:DUF3786 domain-containing protein [Thermodesulfovibrionales bacterium]